MWIQLLWVLAMTAFIDAVMLEGCPHCGDGIPKIVTWTHFQYDKETQFVGDWDQKLKTACLAHGQMRIIACKPIEDEIDAVN